jgi:aminoglycoside 2'-N-acetyltransferase I
VLTTPELEAGPVDVVRRFVVAAFAGDFAAEDWEHALGGLHVLVLDADDVPVAHAALVPRTIEIGGRPFRAGYVEAVATDPARDGEGFGSLAMTGVAELVRRDYELGALSTSRHGFYRRLGWESWAGPTYVRHSGGDGGAGGATRWERTEDEDDGVMVLRCAASRDIYLHAAISCEARSGDDW